MGMKEDNRTKFCSYCLLKSMTDEW